MKTAEEWAKEGGGPWQCVSGNMGLCDCNGPCVDLLKLIRAAQRDAIEAAAAFVADAEKLILEKYENDRPTVREHSTIFASGLSAAHKLTLSLLPSDP